MDIELKAILDEILRYQVLSVGINATALLGIMGGIITLGLQIGKQSRMLERQGQMLENQTRILERIVEHLRGT